MSALDALPLRDHPSGLPVPPARLPVWSGRRPLKRWRYVGLYGERVMLCAAQVEVARLPLAFWAIWDRQTHELRERTVRSGRGVTVGAGSVRFPEADLALRPDGDPVEVTSRHGDSYIWTRKQPVLAVGSVDGVAVELRGLVDDSAGYHARDTAWAWSAGVGEDAAGRALAWNLVTGVHDAPTDSERTLWIDGAAREVPAGRFADDLSAIAWPSGARLEFAEEARRARTEDYKIFASDYVQPFGTFRGTMPGGVEVARGWGVMERHRARW
jgi:hypothetical protein